VVGPVSIGLPIHSITMTSVGEKGVRFSDCSDLHVGEVVGYRDARTVSTGTQTNDQWCSSVASDYQMRATVGLGGQRGESWAPVIPPRFMVILSALSGPQAFRWAACALTSPGFELYRGSFVESMTQGSTPAPFGLCWQTDHNTAWTSCTSPHRIQEFGTTTSTVNSQTQTSCAELIARMTGMPDITDGGLLQPDVVVTSTAASNDDATPATAPTAKCRLSVLGHRSLVGTLLGVGNQSLPWS
jgi:hypothetical protein